MDVTMTKLDLWKDGFVLVSASVTLSNDYQQLMAGGKEGVRIRHLVKSDSENNNRALIVADRVDDLLLVLGLWSAKLKLSPQELGGLGM